ncbi:hypothetical protein BDR22DRAFT_887595 [Usnea florida]
MAELALIASIVQVVDVGIRVSSKLYTFGQTVASADESIAFISKDISHTCSILKLLEHSLQKDRGAQLYSQNDIGTAETIVKECLGIFHEMDSALSKKIKRIGSDGSSSKAPSVALERVKWPFLKPKMMILWKNLAKLKSSLSSMLTVFIYARHLVERPEESSLVNDQRSIIQHLLRTAAQQTCGYESLKAPILRNENHGSARTLTIGNIPVAIDLGAATLTKVPEGSKANALPKNGEASPANIMLEHYCTLMENLMTEIEAKKYNIGDDLRCRIRDDVIHTYKREARLLGVIQGDTVLDEEMRKRSRRLEEIAEDRVGGQQSQMKPLLEPSSGPEFASLGDNSPKTLQPNSDRPSQEVSTPKQASDHSTLPAKVCKATLDQVGTSVTNPPILDYINRNIQEYPWNPLHLVSDAPRTGQPRAPEEDGSPPFGIFGTSMRAFHKLLPLGPLKSHIQNEYSRSGTSLLVTERSHVLDTIASASDLAALTDSTDSTDTRSFESARSEIGEPALDVQDHRFVEGEQNRSLVVLDGKDYDDSIVNEGGKIGTANADPLWYRLLQLGLTSYDGQ